MIWADDAEFAAMSRTDGGLATDTGFAAVEGVDNKIWPVAQNLLRWKEYR